MEIICLTQLLFCIKFDVFLYEEIHFLRKRERNIYTHEGEKIEEKS